ncbi:DUF6233 domain-containing protein [Streptomyces sp. NPDC002589]|uniref:DUF6233 domain-containing protein n=1 Tax=Streptomyces sp. NPDC002589 TaxID=3154420 RepID=UPI00331C8D22
MLHAPDCEEAPQGAPLLDVEHALNLAENPGTRLCTLCAHDGRACGRAGSATAARHVVVRGGFTRWPPAGATVWPS